MAAAKDQPPTHPELRRVAEILATPIDFDQLIAAGVLRKARGWYEVVDPSRLPAHALYKMRALKTGNRVKFRKPSKRLSKFLQTLTEDNGPPGAEPAQDEPHPKG
jgi:hypothetical protein